MTSEKRENQNARTVFRSDQKKDFIYRSLEESPKTLHQLEAALKDSGMNDRHIKDTLGRMYAENLVTKQRFYCSESNRHINRYSASGIGFRPKSYDECVEFLRNARDAAYNATRGKYDDMIDKNPNLRKYAGKKSLLDTKDHSYFGSGQKMKVNRGIGSTWSMYDSASGFDS